MVDGLYSASVPIEDQSEAARYRAMRAGLSDVLVKLSGSRLVLGDPGVRQVVRQAANYISEYSYNSREIPRTPELGEQSEQSEQDEQTEQSELGEQAEQEQLVEQTEERLYLDMQFAAGSVGAVLRDLGLPVWPADRPRLLMWLVANGPEGAYFVARSDNEAAIFTSEMAMQSRGVPFATPLLDLSDRLVLSPDEAWGFDETKLSEASRRYGIDHWLVLRISEISSGQFEGAWLLSGGTEASRATVSANSVSQFIEDSIDQAIDQFGSALTYLPGQSGEAVHLLITQIDDYQDFTAVMALLNELEVVVRTQVSRVEGSELALNVVIEGDPQVLIQALEKHALLTRVVEMARQPGLALQPSYRFLWQQEGQ